MAIGLSLTSSFIVGAIKSRMAKKNWVRGGIEMAGLGTGVALVGYGIESELNKIGLVRIQVIFHEQTDPIANFMWFMTIVFYIANAK